MKKRYALIVLFLSCVLGIGLFIPCSVDAAAPKVTFEWLIEPRFDRAMNFAGGLAWATEESGKGNATTWKLFNSKGKVVVKKFRAFFIQEYVYDEKTGIGLAAFTATFGPQKQEGYLDRSGKIAIPTKYQFTKYFREGLASVKAKNGKYGVINSRGETILPFIYESTVVWDSNMLMVGSGDKSAFVDVKGKTITDFCFNLPYTTSLPEAYILESLAKKRGH